MNLSLLNGVTILFFLVWSFAYAIEKQNDPSYRLIKRNGQEIHVMEVDPQFYKIVAIKASDKLSRNTVSSFVKESKAFAGINGGFFSLDKSDKALPSGALKIQGKWVSLARIPRAAIGWNEADSSVLMDRIITKTTQKKGNKVIEVIPQIDKSLMNKKMWQQREFIVGGTPLLIKNGKIIKNHSIEKVALNFIKEKHARTAVCVKQNQHWVFVVASHTKPANRPFQSNIIEGFTIDELTQFLYQLGCQQAINLDGGGSSTLVIHNKIMNTAGDMEGITHLYHERPVSDAILIFKRDSQNG